MQPEACALQDQWSRWERPRGLWEAWWVSGIHPQGGEARCSLGRKGPWAFLLLGAAHLTARGCCWSGPPQECGRDLGLYQLLKLAAIRVTRRSSKIRDMSGFTSLLGADSWSEDSTQAPLCPSLVCPLYSRPLALSSEGSASPKYCTNSPAKAFRDLPMQRGRPRLRKL